MELFDTGRREKSRTPTPPQMKFLHVLAQGRLEFIDRPFSGYSLFDSDGKDYSHRFAPKVAVNVVLHGWAEMKTFRNPGTVYRLSTEGREVIKELCKHAHRIKETTEVLGGKAICKQCGRAVRCKSKQPTPHPANRFHWKYGPMCNPCWDFLQSKAQ